MMKSPLAHLFRGTLVAAPILLVGTAPVGDSQPWRTVVQGTFEVTLSGAKTGTIQGEALFYEIDLTNLVRIVLWDYRSDDDHFAVQLVAAEAGTPGEGEQPMTAFGSEGFRYGIMIGGDAMWMLDPQAEGTITITHASADRIAGSFTIGGDIYYGGEGAVTVEGTFDAPRGEETEIPEEVR